MKPFYKSLFVLAAATSGAFAQTTATTPPVGYVTLTVPAESDNYFSLPLQTASSWAGVSTGVSGDVISVAASSFTASQYAPGDPKVGATVSSNNYLIQVTSGALTGRQFKVTANGTGDVTVDPAAANTLAEQGFASGDSFVIRPQWTLATAFPGGAGFGSTNDITAPVTMLLVTDNSGTATDRAASGYYTYDDGSDTGLAGWYNVNDYTLSDDLILDPANTFTARNQSLTPLTLVVSGTVPTVPVASLVTSDVDLNDNNLQISFPVDTSLAGSHLHESNVVTATSDITAPIDLVLTFDSTFTGYDPSATGFYTYDDGGDMGTPGWYDVNTFLPVDSDLLLKAGSIVVVRKGQAAQLSASAWTAPLPYTL